MIPREFREENLKYVNRKNPKYIPSPCSVRCYPDYCRVGRKGRAGIIRNLCRNSLIRDSPGSTGEVHRTCTVECIDSHVGISREAARNAVSLSCLGQLAIRVCQGGRASSAKTGKIPGRPYPCPEHTANSDSPETSLVICTLTSSLGGS